MSPARVAIIGAGPSGFYAAEALLEYSGRPIQVDMFDRLPTPFGLVRGGVAPDHQKIKSVTRVYDKIAMRPGFRFLGNVTFGVDLTCADMPSHYHAVVVASGADTDRRMGIPGEDAAGSHAATDFVGWYNGQPERAELRFDLSHEHAVVVGNGNVAVDVARILVAGADALAATDIADHALDALARSAVRHVDVLGRRGPAQAAFTPKEIRELAELPGVTLVVDPADLALDAVSEAHLDDDARKVMTALHAVAGRTPASGDRVVRLRFLCAPMAIVGTGRVQGVELGDNVIVDDDGPRAQPTGRSAFVPAGLVLRAIGYRGTATPGLAFDERRGVIPSRDGRILDSVDGASHVGWYVAGWIKRGPTGVIGTNKPDARSTVQSLLADLEAGVLPTPSASSENLDRLLAQRCDRVVSYDDWQVLDEIERKAGDRDGRPRRKFTTVAAMTPMCRSVKPELWPLSSVS